MNTPTKIVALLVVVSLTFLGGLSALIRHQAAEAHALMAGRTADQLALIDWLVTLHGNLLSTFVSDYSRWDEMLEFIHRPDPLWARDNVQTALAIYAADAVWIYDAQFKLIHVVTALPDAVATRITPLADAHLRERLQDEPTAHFFVLTPAGPVEIRAAPVTPSAVAAGAAPPGGFLLAARLWSDELRRDLGALTQAEVTIGAPHAGGDGNEDPRPGVVSYRRILRGSDGSPVAELHLRRIAVDYQRWLRAFEMQVVSAVALVLTLLLVTYVCLRRWVTGPLRVIGDALSHSDPAALAILDRQSSDFARIAVLAREFFAQRDELLREIGERKHLQTELQFLASHDPVTGLPNRRLFRDRLEQALLQAQRRAEQVAVLFLDLDHFKQVNDSHGHAVGDLVLKHVAQRLRECVRGSDTVGRLGGDEFVLCLSDVHGVADVARVCDKIIASVARPIFARTDDVIVTCSIGVSMFPDDGHDIDTLIDGADGALYQAKAAGRNRTRFHAPQTT
ncbi:MAG: diguanylate cyclase [Gammaproteobacteria bacterium]|nr:diguanylate cyclase [Gammaproteobacteria bacterium]